MFISNARNFAGITILIAFVATILLCAWSAGAVTIEEPMNDCATQQNPIALCGASPMGHLLIWQNFLHVTPQKMFDILLAKLLLAVGFFASRGLLHAPHFVTQYLRAKIREGLSIVDPIRRALSRGIIQPQMYELVIG